MEVFLEMNGFVVSASDKEMVELALSIDLGKYDAEAIIRWLSKHVERQD